MYVIQYSQHLNLSSSVCVQLYCFCFLPPSESSCTVFAGSQSNLDGENLPSTSVLLFDVVDHSLCKFQLLQFGFVVRRHFRIYKCVSFIESRQRSHKYWVTQIAGCCHQRHVRLAQAADLVATDCSISNTVNKRLLSFQLCFRWWLCHSLIWKEYGEFCTCDRLSIRSVTHSAFLVQGEIGVESIQCKFGHGKSRVYTVSSALSVCEVPAGALSSMVCV